MHSPLGTHIHVSYICTCITLAFEEKTSLTTIFKKSFEYEEIQTVLQPLLSKALNGSRATAPQYNTYFPWQVVTFIKNV